MAELKRHRDVLERVLESGLPSAPSPKSESIGYGNRFEQSREGLKEFGKCENGKARARMAPCLSRCSLLKLPHSFLQPQLSG